MTKPIERTVATDVNGGSISGDGLAVIEFAGPDGPFNVTLPANRAMRLTSVCAQIAGPLATPGQRARVHLIKAEGWTVYKAENGRVVFGFEPAGGGSLAFGVHPDAAFHLLEALAVTLGVATVRRPQGPTN